MGYLTLGLLVVAASLLHSHGELLMQLPPRPARIYKSAPSGLLVTEVRVIDTQQEDQSYIDLNSSPRYYLQKDAMDDNKYFSIGETNGKLTTNRYIDKDEGEIYRVMIVAFMNGLAINTKINITVTQYNNQAPQMDQQLYSAEVLENTESGTGILSISATDADLNPINSEIYYFLAPEENPLDENLNKENKNIEENNPFLYTSWSPLSINTSSGEVLVKKALNVSWSPLRINVGAMDGGSPKRQHHVQLTVYIRDISAPLSVEILNTTETTMTVCWVPPKHGVPQGYTLTYTPMPRGRTGVLNLTLDDLTISEKVVTKKAGKETFTTKEAPIERYCAKVGGLQSWVEYVVRVRAWAGIRVSMGAEPITAITRSDFCAAGVCGDHGNCTLQQEGPGYVCHCEIGYYGDHCKEYNPCLTGTPCSGYGTCINTTSNGFTCNCFSGFYGKDCSRFDPCQAVSSNPCQNGGTCRRKSPLPSFLREESGSYKCQCQPGFWGSTCEHWDPCSSGPCQNMATCTNITDIEYSCTCTPGYTGSVCQLDIDECSAHQCQNGATCNNHVAYYTCTCKPGYTGVYCEEEIDECTINPCVHGVCVDRLADFECQCQEGWGGKTCDTDLDSCPAETTSTSIGIFVWPPTKHGKEVTVKCPYGITSTTQTLLQNTEINLPITTTYLSITTSNVEYKSTVTLSPTQKIPTTLKTRTLQYEAVNEVPKIVSSAIPFETTAYAEWEESTSTNEKRHRRDLIPDMKMKQERNLNDDIDDNIYSATPELKQEHIHRPSARHRLIHSRMRGTKGVLRSQTHHQRQHNSRQTSTENMRSHSKHRKPSGHKGFSDNERNRHHSRSLKYTESDHITEAAIREEQIEELRVVENNNREESLKIHPTLVKSQISEDKTGNIRLVKLESREKSETRITETQTEEVQIQNPGEGYLKIQETSIVEKPAISDTKLNLPDAMKNTGSKEKQIDESYVNDSTVFNTDRFTSKIEPISFELFNELQKSDFEKSESNILNEDINQNILFNREEENDSQKNNKIENRDSVDTLNLDLDEVSLKKLDDNILINLKKREYIEDGANTSKRKNPFKETYHNDETTESILVGGTRSCVLLPNGTIIWEMPDTTKCRAKETQEAEETTKNLADMTSAPKSVNVDVFTNTAKQLSDLVNLALDDTRVAVNLVDVISNMMDVNDSVIAEGEEENNTSQTIVKTINTFAEKVKVDPGNKVTLHSSNLVVEARVLSPEYGKLKAMFRPYQDQPHEPEIEPPFLHRKRRGAENSNPQGPTEPYLVVPPEALSLAVEENIRLQFVSYSNDKFFRGRRPLHMPVITASIRNTKVVNLTEKVQYYIPIQHLQEQKLLNHSAEDGNKLIPICVYWDETVKEWSSEGVETMVHENITSCASTHLTAFSVLLEPVPLALGVHETALSAITYFGLTLSTIGLAVTVATYAIFRTLNRDRSGKIVMNLSLALLLLNVIFLVTTGVKPPSAICTTLAAALHYVVLAAFAWMLVEAANMYQLLITVFASQEMYFMAKRIAGAWGLPLLFVSGALIADYKVYGDEERGFCVITSKQNPIVYYITYLGPICLVLVVNCVVFILVTRVLCQRRPQKNKAQSGSKVPPKQGSVTLAQVRGAITVVALLGVTWVSGAFSVGWARIPLLYIMCITTPIQGLIIFVVRVAQHPEARSSWLTLLTTGTLRKRPQPSQVHSSNHTHTTSSAGHTPPRNTLSSTLTSSIRSSTSLRGRGALHSLHKNGDNNSCKSRNRSTVRKQSSNDLTLIHEKDSFLQKIMNQFSSNGKSNSFTNGKDMDVDISKNKSILSVSASTPGTIQNDDLLHEKDSLFRNTLLNDFHYEGNLKGSIRRPKSLVLLRTDNHGSVSACKPTSLRRKTDSEYCKDNISPILGSPNLESTISSTIVSRRSLGSLLLLAEGKEGDDSSWHFVGPSSESQLHHDSLKRIGLDETKHTKNTKYEDKGRKSGFQKSRKRCESGDKYSQDLKIAGQNTKVDLESNRTLAHASGEQHMAIKDTLNPATLQRSISVYTPEN